MSQTAVAPSRKVDGASDVAAAARVDILETDDELYLFADMPGVLPDDVDVRFENGELAVHGRRSPSHADKQRVLWEAEAPGYFRTFRVTERVDADKIEADLKDGVLKLRLPKAEAAKPRRIAVKG